MSKIAKQSTQTLLKIAAISEKSGKWDVCVKALNLLIKQFPRRPNLYNQLAQAYVHLGDRKKASETFKKSADAYLRLGNHTMALSVLHRASQYDPHNELLKAIIEQLEKKTDIKEFKSSVNKMLGTSTEEAFNAEQFQELLHELNDEIQNNFIDVYDELKKDQDQKEDQKPQDLLIKLEPLYSKSPFLKHLGHEHLVTSSPNLKLEYYPIRTCIQKMGTSSLGLILVISGRVTALFDRNGTSEVLKNFNPGEMVVPLDRGISRTKVLTLEAAEGTEILLLTWKRLEEIEKKNQALQQYLENEDLKVWSEILIARSELFQSIDLKKIQDFRKLCNIKDVPAEKLIIEEGTLREPQLLFLIKGHASAMRGIRSSSPLHLIDLEPGAFFGERGFLAPQPSMASIQAKTPCKILTFSKALLDEALRIHPDILQQLQKSSEHHIHATLQKELARSSSLEHQWIDPQAFANHALTLQEAEFFKSLTNEQREDFLQFATSKTLSEGESLASKNQEVDGLLIISSGCVRAIESLDTGEIQLIKEFGPGDIVGTEALFQKEKQLYFDYEVTKKTDLLWINFNQVDAIGGIFPTFKKRLESAYRELILHDMASKSSYFRGLSHHQKKWLSQFKFESYKEGSSIIQEKSKRHPELYLLVKGMAAVYKETKPGERLVLAHLMAGDVFGEAQLISGRQSSAFVSAESDVEVIKWSEQDLAEVIKEIPSFVETLVRFYRERTMSNMDTLVDLWRKKFSS